MSYVQGLQVELYQGINFDSLVRTNIEETINLDDNFDTGDGDEWSIRAQGEIQAWTSGTNRWYTLSDDRVRIWINGELAVNNATDHPQTYDLVTATGLTNGQWYSIKIEFAENTEVAKLALRQYSDYTQLVPKEQLRFNASAPTFQSAATSTDGTQVVLTYDEVLSYEEASDWVGGTSSTTPAASAFAVTTDGSANAVTAVAVSGSTVELTLTRPIASGQTITVTYTDPNSGSNDSDAVQDSQGNDAESLSSASVTNNSTRQFAQRGSDIDGDTTSDFFGRAVSLSNDGSVIAVGAETGAGDQANAGHVQIYKWNTGTSAWDQRGSTINGEVDGDKFGESVTLSGDGNIVAIGASNHDKNGVLFGDKHGHVQIYEWDGSSWNQLGSDLEGEARQNYSGFSISLTDDGTIVAIGAGSNDGGGTKSGHTRIYKYDGSSWNQLGVDLDGAAAGDRAGHAVAISGDGQTLAIGSPQHDNATDKGYVSLYKLNGTSWEALGSDIVGEAAGDESGRFGLALSEDGTIVAIGAMKNTGGGTGTDTGHTRIFQWNSDTTSWDQLGSDIDGEAAGDLSGRSVALSANGAVLAIGAIENDGGGSNAGHVRIYQFVSGSWVKTGEDIEGLSANDETGISISLSEDGNTLAVGSGSSADYVRIFDLNLDVTSPTFSSAATNTDGTKVVLTYNEALSSTTATTSNFAVTTDGSANAVTAVAVSGSTVELTLTNAVKNDQAVTVAYTDPSASNDTNAVQDSKGNDAADLSSTSVTNNSTVAGTPPTFSSAATNTDGTKVVLTYNEALSSTTATTSNFAVTTDGSANAVTAVAVSGSTVELTLTNAVKNDQAVTVAYTDPSASNDTNAVQDSKGNDAADLSSTSVTNNSTVAGTPPTFSSAATNTDGTKVVLTYNEALSSTTATTSNFAVTTDGSANAVTAVAVSGSTVELTLTNAVKNDQAVTVAYTDPSASNDTNAVQDSKGNDAADLSSTSVTNNSTVAGTPPTFSSAATNTDGTKVVLTYNEALSSTTATTSNFAVTSDGSANAVTAVAVSGSTVELTLTNAVKNDQAVTVAYTDPSASNDTNAVQDSKGNDAADLSSTSVTNNSTVAGTPPTFSSAATNTDGTKVVLTYNEALSSTTATTSNFAVTTDGSANAVTAVAVSGSTVELTLTNAVKNDQAVTVAYTDPSASNDTNAVQDSKGNDAADLSSTSVTNNSTVAGSPIFQSAATNTDGTKVVLTYDEALSSATAAAPTFAVSCAGIANPVTDVAVSGSTVELTLTSAVKDFETVTVAYTDPSASNDTNAVQDSAGNDAADLTSTAVTNNSTVKGRGFQDAGDNSTLKSSTTDDWYGTAVTLSKDGSTMAVGVPRAAGGGTRRGQVRIYKRSGEDWNLIDTINGVEDKVQQGQAVSLSADGTIIAIGASNFDKGSLADAGHVRTFQYNGSSFTEFDEVKGSGAGENLGKEVALSADGKVLVVGASGHNYSSKSDVGLVRIYRLSDANQWIQEKYFRGDTANSYIGKAVAISADGDTVAVGGYGNTSQGTQNGRIALFRYNSSKKKWLTHGRGRYGVADEDKFGQSLSLSADGSALAVGAPQNDNDGNNKGRVDIYEIQESGGLQPLGLPIYGEADDDHSGVTVSLADNGKRVAIAAHLNDGGGTDSGHVRLYEFINGSWQQQGIDLDGPTKNSFRNSENTAISLSGDGTHLAIGSPASHDSAPSVEGTVRILKFHDSVTPTLSSIQTSIDGEKIIVKFSENLSADLPNSSQFSVKSNGTTIPITGIKANGPTIELTLNQAIASSDSNIQVSYTDSSSSNDSTATQDFSGNDASSFSNQSATNLSTVGLGSRFLVDKDGNKFAEYGYAKVGAAFQQIDLNLSGGFSAPLVFSNVVSRNEQDPVATRLNAVTSSSFEVQLDEPKYISGKGTSYHTDEIVSYFVIEEGKHELADGKIFLAKSEGQKKHPSNPVKGKSNQWSSTIPFTGANFSDIPVVFGQSQTHRGNDFITTRTKNVSSTGFQYTFQEAENKGSHPAQETFAWMAYSGGKSNSGGIELEGQALDKVFTHVPKQQSFLNTYTTTPFLLSGLRTFEDSDPAFSRIRDLNISNFTVGIQEESSSSGNVDHNSQESIHYLAIGTSAPPSIQSATKSFAENSDTTSQVTVIDLQDSNTLKDESPDGEAISYSIKSGNTDLFAINASTGVITIKAGASLDYETATSYSLTISAQAGNASTEAVITVNITEANDNDVVLSDNNSSQNTVTENASTGTTVGITALGTDADRGVSISSYALIDNAGGLFAINSSTGVVTVNGAIDYESKQSHTITVKATSSDSSATTKDFTINVTDVDDNTLSVADSNSATNTIAENATAGDGVGVTALGTDADFGTSIAYDFTSNPSDLFSINASTGVITLADGKTLDYESAQSHTVKVRATSTDSNGDTSTATKEISIAVTDVDDNTLSVADSNSATNTIAENASSGDTVGVTALGTDADYGTSIAYDFTSNPSDLFAINASTGVITLADGKTLDYESAQSHTVKVRATSTDSNSNTSTATKEVTIAVSDVNDIKPVIDDQIVTVKENVAAGTAFLNINDSSQDDDVDAENNDLSYTIQSGNTDNLFQIDADTGELSIASGQSLTYVEGESNQYILVVQASDGALTDTANITIKVGNVDTSAPDIGDAPKSIAESISSGTEVIDINDERSGQDQDNDGDAITYTFTSDGNPGSLFAINASTGQITLADGQSLDYENANQRVIRLVVQASDGSKTDQATITINVTDVDDNTLSVADSNSAANTIAENATAGDGVGVIALGTDADYGTSIAYDFTSNPSDLFAINASTGVITLADGKTLDYESAQSHTVKVRATSTDSNGNTSTATKEISIAVTDVDDNTLSVADNNSAANTIAENATSGDTVGVIALGTDADYGTSIAYDFTSNPSDLFAINASTGVITLANGKTLDYESAQSHTVKVRATSTDSNSNTSTATKEISIAVTDVDDNILSVADSNSATNTIAENATSGDTVGVTALGTDADYGTSIAYDFTSNPSDLFAINASTGVITLADGKTLDYESAQSHTVKVRATSTDSNSNTSTATKEISIAVTDVDEFTPSLSDGDSTANTAAEDATAGTTVGVTAKGSDGDAGTSFSYAFASDGNPDVLFDLNSTTGVVMLAGSLDYETATSHSIKVVGTATDSNGGSKTTEETFKINVGNVNDNDPALASQSVEVLDSISAGTELADLKDSNTSNDTDRDGDAIQYSITAGNENSLFTINETAGKLSLATGKSLDCDKSDQHVLTIKATDAGGRSGTATITIDVQDSNTAPNAVDDAITLNEDSTIDIAAASGIIQNNDSDAESDSLTVHKLYLGESTETDPVEGILGQAINGTYGLLTLNADGSYQYLADNANALSSGETAVDSFHYVLTDNKLTQTADIKFTITGINNAPSLVDATKKKSYTEKQGRVTVIDGSLDIVDHDDTEIEGAIIKFSSDTYVASEDKLDFTSVSGITDSWDSSTGTLSLTGSASISDYITALESVTYENKDDIDPVTGERIIEWTVNDGEASSTAITSIVDVGGTNDAPECVDEAVTLDASSTISTETQDKLLVNDTGPEEADFLTIQQFRLGTEQQSNVEFLVGTTLTGQYGRMTIESDGSYTYVADQIASKRLLTGETRTETFTYTVSDSKDTDTGEITFSITGINDSPIATNDAFEIEEDSSKYTPDVQGLLANDSDIDGDSLSISTVRTGAETSTQTIRRNALSRTATGTYGTIVINEDGSYRYTADQASADALDPGDQVNDLFTYTLSDGENTDSAEINLNVIGINDAPTLSEITAGSISDLENSTDLDTRNLSGQLTASDPDASASLSFGITSVNNAAQTAQTNQIGISAKSTLVGSYGSLSLNNSTGAYNYTPNSAAIEALNDGESASDSFALYVSDGIESHTNNYTVTINGATDPSQSPANPVPVTPTPTTPSTPTPVTPTPVTPTPVTPTPVTPTPVTPSTNTTKYFTELFALDQTSKTHTSITYQTSQEGNQLISTFGTDALINYNSFQTIESISPYDSLLSESGGSPTLRSQSDGGGSQEKGIKIISNPYYSDCNENVSPHENAINNAFFVVLTSAPTSEVKVTLSTPDEFQGVLSRDELYFTPENWNIPQKVSFTTESLGASEENAGFSVTAKASANGGYTGTEQDSAIFSINNASKPVHQTSTTKAQESRSAKDPINLDIERVTVHEELSPMFTILRIISFPAIAIISFALNSIERFQSDISPSSQPTDQNNNHHQTSAFQIEPIEVNHLQGIGSASDFRLSDRDQCSSAASSLLLAQMSQTTDCYF